MFLPYIDVSASLSLSLPPLLLSKKSKPFPWVRIYKKRVLKACSCCTGPLGKGSSSTRKAVTPEKMGGDSRQQPGAPTRVCIQKNVAEVAGTRKRLPRQKLVELPVNLQAQKHWRCFTPTHGFCCLAQCVHMVAVRKWSHLLTVLRPALFRVIFIQMSLG